MGREDGILWDRSMASCSFLNIGSTIDTFTFNRFFSSYRLRFALANDSNSGAKMVSRFAFSHCVPPKLALLVCIP